MTIATIMATCLLFVAVGWGGVRYEAMALVVGGIVAKEGEEDLEKGNLFATGLVAGGALMGVLFAFLNIPEVVANYLGKLSAEHGLVSALGEVGYYLLGVAFFALMGWMLYRTGMKKDTELEQVERLGTK